MNDSTSTAEFDLLWLSADTWMPPAEVKHSQWMYRFTEKRNWTNRIHLWKHRVNYYHPRRKDPHVYYFPKLRKRMYAGNWNERIPK